MIVGDARQKTMGLIDPALPISPTIHSLLRYPSLAGKPCFKTPGIPGWQKRGQKDRTGGCSGGHPMCLHCSLHAVDLSSTFLLSLDSFCFVSYFSHFLHFTTTGLFSLSRLYPPHLFINKKTCKVFVSNNDTEQYWVIGAFKLIQL